MKKIETLETLKDNKSNQLYDIEHKITDEDVEIVNRIKEIIENQCHKMHSGCTVIMHGLNIEGKKVYQNGIITDDIERVHNGGINMCTQPYIAHVNIKRKNPDDFYTDISGGYFLNEPDKSKVKLIGKIDREFWTWGRNGACGHGGIYFYARVNLYEYHNEQDIY